MDSNHSDQAEPGNNNAPETIQTRSLTPLSYLSAPVPDYASSLLSHLGDHADDANTAFLRESLDSMSSSAQARSTVDQTRDPRLGLSRRQRNVSLNRSGSPTHRDRLQRYLSHLYRVHHPPASTSAAYSNRTPSPHRQSIYDWAPSNTEQVDSGNGEATQPGRQSEDHEGGGVSLNAEHVSDSRMAEVDATEHALPSATARMLRFFMDRERSGLSEEEERARGTGWYRPEANRADIGRRNDFFEQEVNTRARQEHLDAFRRHYLPAGHHSSRTNESTRRPTMPNSVLENAVRYLDDLQRCDSYDEALAAAIDHDLTTKDLFASKHDEFILDLAELDRPYETSFLLPGTVFKGHQYATTTILSRARDVVRHTITEQINPNYRPLGSNDATSTSRPSTRDHRNSLFHGPPAIGTGANKGSSDHWPVMMTIHQVDEENMTIQGTMEAFDVPRPPSILLNGFSSSPSKSGKKNAPITTYVEGHIIDFFNHSFLTTPPPQSRGAKYTAFPKATAAQDAENWHRLPPFNEGTVDDMAQLLLSKDRVLTLNQEYLFMRWKERCFVHSKHDKCAEHERRSDHDRGHGLSISGFYYISMRRSDGMIEGIYYDPHSTPHQHLRLTAVTTSWPAWQFR